MVSTLMSLLWTPAIESARHVLEIMTAHRVEGWIHHLLKAAPGRSALDRIHTRSELIHGLFLSSAKPTEYMPPRDWSHNPPDIDLGGGFKTYRHEVEVLRSIAHFLDGELVTWDEKTKPWAPHLKCSRVILGSGSSNKASAQVIGTPGFPAFSPKIGDYRVDLSYAIGMGNGTVKRRQYGEYIYRSAHAIYGRHNRALIQADRTATGLLKDDYLLVTRVPGEMKRTVFTVLSGLHGPGTRSAQLLFETVPTKDLEELASRVGYKSGKPPYFQAVFRASGMRSQKEEGSVVPTKIELVTEKSLEPVRIRL